MYRQLFFTQKQDELLHVVPAEEYLLNRIGSKASPFHSLPFWTRVVAKIVCGLFALIQKLFGTKFYVHNELRELSTIKPQLRNLLLSLIKKDIISTWQWGRTVSDLPNVTSCDIKLKDLYSPSGKQCYFSGTAGAGWGNTVNESLTKALAELLERHSICNTDETKIISGTFKELQRQGAVDPCVFSFYSKQQLKEESFALSCLRPSQSFGWMKAYSLIDKKYCLIPAQLVYMFYNMEHRDEPVFWQSTVNGAAAGGTFNEASCNAICEAIERDAFLIFWLNKIPPPQIILESIFDDKIQKLVKEIREYDLELFILDITTDINIPSFAAVLLDRKGGVATLVTATTDFDIEGAIKKIIFDALQFAHFPPDMSPEFVDAIQKKSFNIDTIEERHTLWSDQKMIRHIDFLLRGKKKKFSEISRAKFPQTPQLQLSEIKKTLKEKKYDCYIVDATSKEARAAGLSVVKAIIPQLVPIYFQEKKKPLGVKRLYSVPRRLGYSNTPRGDDDFNSIPHPFV